jgi:hypothetical protein
MEKMKFVLASFLVLFCVISASAWDDCPFGLVNDTYPGECGRYIDTNIDGICDHSQTFPTTSLYVSTTTSSVFSTTSITVPVAAQPVEQKPITGEYNFLPLFAGILIIYFLSEFLSRRGILLSAYTHKRIWNLLLFFTFIVAGLTGILLILRLDQRWDIPFIRDVTFWHVETGLAMTIIAFFHLAWHWKYYLSMLRNKKEK